MIVVLQSRKDSESEWEYAAYTVTDENGRYEFTELESSSRITKEYRVVFNLSENTHITALNSGNNSAVDSDAIGTYMTVSYTHLHRRQRLYYGIGHTRNRFGSVH